MKKFKPTFVFYLAIFEGIVLTTTLFIKHPNFNPLSVGLVTGTIAIPLAAAAAYVRINRD